MMSTLFMIRHGQASFGQANYDQLSDLGIEQAKLLGEYYRELGICFDECYTGTMQRHLDTADHFFQVFSGEKTPCWKSNSSEAFNEYDPEAVLRTVIPILIEENPDFSRDVENMFTSRKSFQIVFEKAILKWVSGNVQAPGLVSWEEYSGRVQSGIQEIMKFHGKGKKIAVFSSGGPISAAIQKALCLSNTASIQVNWQIINSSVTRFKFTQDRIMMMSFNEHAHLEMKKEDIWITYR
jgi:broad specificity phosphatase PhoE